MDETTALNDLQNVGIISDHCVRAADVAQADQRAAIEFLKFQPEIMEAERAI